MRYIIKDWTGKVCFFGKTFKTFEDGWAYIWERDPEPEPDSSVWKDGWFDDYYVTAVEMKCRHCGKAVKRNPDYRDSGVWPWLHVKGGETCDSVVWYASAEPTEVFND